MYAHLVIIEAGILQTLRTVTEQLIGEGHVAMPHSTHRSLGNLECGSQHLLQVSYMYRT